MAGFSERPDTFFRLSPAESGKAQCFAVRRGDVRSVTNAHVLYSEHYGDLRALSLCRYPLGTIGDMLDFIQDGLHGVRRYVPIGIPLLGVGNVTEDGVDLTEVNRITEEEHERLAASHVKRGDLLVTITGRLGTCAVYDSDAPANLSAHVALCRAKPEHELLYLKHYLASRFGAASLTKAQIGSTHPHINVRRLAELPIPLPDQQRQEELATTMEKARAERRAKLAEADALLAGLDGYVLDTLGLMLPPRDERNVFAVRRGAVPARFDPHFHLPEFAQILRMLSANGSEPLGNLVTFSKETWKPEQHEGDTFRYIEISGVDRGTGEASAVETSVAEAPSRARMAVADGDIIVSLTRPHHGSIAQITPELDGCVASTGFAVLRGVDEARVLRDYLWCILRAKICLTQMLQRASGGNYPAITEPELAKVLIPVPDLDIQKTIATEARRRSEEARRLRAEAEAGWQQAKRWFEEQLLGPALP